MISLKPIGVLVIKLSNRGPFPVYNDSLIDLEVSMKLGITGLTLRSLGETEEEKQDEQFFRLIGPIPVPDIPEYCALGMAFAFDVKVSEDEYFETFGMWIIIDSDYKEIIYQNYDKIQQILVDFIKTYQNEEELENGIKIKAFKNNFLRQIPFE